MTTTYCPDCEWDLPDEEFVAHREAEHPPELKILTIPDALHSGERMGWTNEE